MNRQVRCTYHQDPVYEAITAYLHSSTPTPTNAPPHQQGNRSQDTDQAEHHTLTCHEISRVIHLIASHHLVPDQVLVAALIYDARTQQYRTISRSAWFCVALAIAGKHWDDECYNNATFAVVADISVRQFNMAELLILDALKFRLCISPRLFSSVCAGLQLPQLTMISTNEKNCSNPRRAHVSTTERENAEIPLENGDNATNAIQPA
eukprot:TRINITY_DN12329_c0_g1_i1.p1 TRINITY_DN12329_c0_g1~~TRINITY_DN12329_c0_g1_i1.p1  ORF type:complete len:207 (+),score=43.36 TRINITY_DN12329_c0_g1_i1:131-751(+)